MAREKLFPAPNDDDNKDTRKPHERFEELASKLLRVTKTDLDKRERDWKLERQ